MRRLSVFAMLALTGCGRACGGHPLEPQDVTDQRRARALCGLDEAAVVTWKGYPAEVGFGQREGLRVSGTFALPQGWQMGPRYRPLPWPDARDVVESTFQQGALFDHGGFARCESAGNDILHATNTAPCTSKKPFTDVIVCIVDQTRGVATVFIGSTY